MKAAFVKEPTKVVINDVEQPKLAPGDILVRMQSCGICGSDVEKVFGKYGQPSIRLGHEPAGIVSDIGSNVAKFKKGDRVFTHHHVPCHACHHCKHGNETMCKRYYETNLSPCGLAEEYLVPKWNVDHGGVLKIPDSMSFDEAAMIEPLACCVRSWNKLSSQKGDSIAVFGLGATGMMHVMLAQAKGFDKIFCFDVNEFRLDFAKNFQGDSETISLNSSDPNSKDSVLSQTEGRGVDVAIVATGNLQAVFDAINYLRRGGTVVIFGVPSKGAKMDLDMSVVYSKEITILTSYAASDIDTNEALRLIATSQIDVKRLITHHYPISDSQKAFDHAHKGADSMKIIITR